MKQIEHIGYSLTTITQPEAGEEIRVFCPDITPFTENPGEDSFVDISVKNLNKEGSGSAKVLARQGIKCYYIGNAITNNCTPPCIHKAERVRIISFDNGKTYFWMPLAGDGGKRTTEVMRWCVTDKPDSATEPDDSTMYFIELDTRAGSRHLWFHTCKGTGEEFEYDFKIDSENSIASLTDNKTLLMEMLSKAEAFNIKAGKTVNVTAGTSVNIDAPMTNVLGALHVVGPQTNDSTIVAAGEVTGNSVTLSGHVHTDTAGWAEGETSTGHG